MARYQYAGPGPHDDAALGLVRPGDVRDFDETPDWGPWELLDGPSPEPVAAPELTPDELAELKKTADAELATPAPFLAAPAKPEGM